MRLSDFDYDLPEELIAQEPPAERDGARMLVVHRAEQRFEDRQFRDFPSFLQRRRLRRFERLPGAAFPLAGREDRGPAS